MQASRSQINAIAASLINRGWEPETAARWTIEALEVCGYVLPIEPLLPQAANDRLGVAQPPHPKN